MTAMRTAVLLVAFFATSAVAMQHRYYYSGRIATGGSTCDSHTCGINARCSFSEGRPVCSCFNLHMGDPLVRCERVECIINEDCIGSEVCTSNKCVNPCPTTCGTNAECHTRNHVPTCSCPQGYVGDPFVQCTYDPEAPCKSNPCGVNTKCRVENGVAVCSCLPGFRGRPLDGCRHECESDFDCGAHHHCSKDFRCENPCLSACGDNAECEVVNHRAKCTCPKNWLGNPLSRCHPECTQHSDCGPKLACYNFKCTNPCSTPGICGTHANCEVNPATRNAVCSCPKDRTGNPFEYCRPFTDADLCANNPCGVNAICTPGHDNTGAARPVCTCPVGYIGNALSHCQRGECISDAECPDNRACIDFSCQNPCTGRECGTNASCSPRRHIAVCTCNDGYRGDARILCDLIQGGRSVPGYGRYIRYRK